MRPRRYSPPVFNRLVHRDGGQVSRQDLQRRQGSVDVGSSEEPGPAELAAGRPGSRRILVRASATLQQARVRSRAEAAQRPSQTPPRQSTRARTRASLRRCSRTGPGFQAESCCVVVAHWRPLKPRTHRPENKRPARFPVRAFAKRLISLVVPGLRWSGAAKRKSMFLVGAAGFELATPCTPFN